MSSERLLIEIKNPWWGEHVFRYNFVLENISGGLNILDLACGTGYGANTLCNNGANNVIGGDISEESLKFARQTYHSNGLKFQKIDGANIEFAENHFDVITSFETIEHLQNYEQLVAEFYRVLKTGGQLFLSTPNSLITSPNGVINNKYHVKEFRPEELYSILTKKFSSVKLYGQYFARYTNKSSLRYKLAYSLEKFLYLRGIRKLPISWQDALMKLIINEPLYPEPNNFSLSDSPSQVNSSFVLFAICQK